MMDCQGSTFVCKTRTVGALRKPPRDAADRITTHYTKCFNLNNVDLVKLCPQQQNAIRFWHNIDFRCVLGDLGRFWKGTGFPEPNLQPVPRRGSGRGVVPGSKGCQPEVSKVSVFDGFRGRRSIFICKKYTGLLFSFVEYMFS